MDILNEKLDLLDELEHVGEKGTDPESIRKYLSIVREQKTRESTEVAKYGSILLKSHQKKLKDEELWLIYEQVAIAAIDCQAIQLAKECIRDISKKFPDSNRTKKLKGMLYEATDAINNAEELYKEMLEEDPTNDIALCRMIALYKTKGDIVSAAKHLVKYLDTYMMDKDAWEELGNIYLKLQMYKQAGFCYEELLLLQSSNISYHLKYADIKYTLGSVADLKVAKSHYALAVELSQGTLVRALFGLAFCASRLDKKEFALKDDIGKLCIDSLKKLYAMECPSKLEAINKMFNYNE